MPVSVPACGRGRGAALRGQRRSPAEDQHRGDGAGQRRVADRAERADQNRAEEEGGGVGQRLQREGGGQLVGPFAAQQVRPAGRGQGAELRNERAGAGGGRDRGGRGGRGEDAGDGGAVGEEGERQDAGLAEPVDQAGQLRADQRLGEGETGGGEAGRAVGAGPGVQQPDQAEAGHGDANAADRGAEEEGGGAGGAQQGTVTGSGVGHKGVLYRRLAGRATRGRRRLSAATGVLPTGATRGSPGDVQDCGETGHAPSPPSRHRAERKHQARAKAGRGDLPNSISATAGRPPI